MPIRFRDAFLTAESYAKNEDKELRADDARLQREVVVIHQDGSRLHFVNAHAQEIIIENVQYWQGHIRPVGFLAVWTEHLGTHVFSIGDLEGWYELIDARRPNPGQPIEQVLLVGVTPHTTSERWHFDEDGNAELEQPDDLDPDDPGPGDADAPEAEQGGKEPAVEGPGSP
jgi:hypothetical protein